MANRLFLAQTIIPYRPGILDFCTSARQYLIPITMKITLGGFSPLMANTVSCLCPLSCSFLMLPIFLLCPNLLVPSWTSHVQPLALNGNSVTFCSMVLVSTSFILSLILSLYSHHCSNDLMCRFVPTPPTFLICTMSRPCCNAA